MHSGVVLMLILQFTEKGKGLRNLIMYFAVASYYNIRNLKQ